MASLAGDNFDVFIRQSHIYDIDWKLWLNISHGKTQSKIMKWEIIFFLSALLGDAANTVY